MKHLYTLAFLLLNTFLLHAQTPWLHVQGNKILDPAGNVVILRGVDIKDLQTQNSSSPKVNALIDKLTNTNDPAAHSPGWYPRVIRFTVNPTITNFASYYTNTLKPAVDYATSKGLYVIIDNHFIAPVNNTVYNTYTYNFWAYMAPKFRSYSNVLYEIYNEPSSNMPWATFKPYMQSWINLIRKYAPHNLILAGCPQWDQQISGSAGSPFTGGNIVYVSHIYPLHFKNQSLLNQVQQAAAVNPVMLTEWGYDSLLVSNNVLNGSTTNYGVKIMRWADSLGLSWSAWCADNSWQPAMFSSNWTLRAGPGDMGGFVKDTLYQKRNDHQPANIPCAAPYLGLDQSLCGKTAIAIQTGMTKTGKTFKWYKDNTLLPGETDSILSVTEKGNYHLDVTLDSSGCTMGDDVVVTDTLLPVNLGQDQPETGSAITLVADTSSSDPYIYEWYRNGKLVSGATSKTYTIQRDTCNVLYSVQVSVSGCGSSVSDTMKLLCPRLPYLGYRQTIPGTVEAEYYDVQNTLTSLTYSDADAANNGNAFRTTEGVDIEKCTDTGVGYDVNSTNGKEWMEYSVTVTDTGYYSLGFRIANATTAAGSFHLLVNGVNVTKTVSAPSTGGKQVWTTVTVDNIHLTTIDTLLRFYVDQGGFSINYISFQKMTATAVTPQANVSAGILVYPNPVSETLHISGSLQEEYNWQLLNILGEQVMQGKGDQADMRQLPKGQYILKINEGCFKILKW